MGAARGFARAHAFLEGANVLGSPCNVLVLDLLGPSLDDLFWASREVTGAAGLSAQTVLALLHDGLSRVQHVGARGFSHSDIKPENLLLGRKGTRRGVVHLVDFGTSERLNAQVENGELAGTPRYAPLRAHAVCRSWLGDKPSELERESSLSRVAADVESLLYSMAALSAGVLPWDECLDSNGRILDGCEPQLVAAKAAAKAGDATAWAGAEDTPLRAVLLTLMAHLRAGRPADKASGCSDECAGTTAVDFAWARALVRTAYCELTGRSRMSRVSFDWDVAGVSWPEGDEEVADAVMLSAAAARAASAELTVVGGVSLLTHRARS